MTLVFGHFVVPLFFFLPSTIKRIPNLLFAGAVWLLFIHYVDIYYLIMPNLHHHLHISLMDASTFLGVGGVFLFAFGRLMGADAVIAHRDPRLPGPASKSQSLHPNTNTRPLPTPFTALST